MARKIVGVMGPASPGDWEETAYRLGLLIGSLGYVLLTGGRGEGVMDAASRGAKESGGLVVGILPGANTDQCSQYVDIAIPSGMGSARNNINILASDIVVAVGMGAGTASEISLALKASKKVVLVDSSPEAIAFFKTIGEKHIYVASDADDACNYIKSHFEGTV